MKKLKNLFKKLFVKLFKKDVFYLDGTLSLPEPLTKEQEDELIECMAQGNERARDELIVHNLRLVVYVAKKFESSGIALEDLISIGTIGLIKSVNTFSPQKNTKIATYASRCIENEILMYLRKISSQKLEVSLDEPLNVDWDGNELMLSDVLGSQADEIDSEIESEDEKRVLRNVIETLTPREKTIIDMRYGLSGGKELTQREVADNLGISQSYISRLEKKILKRLGEKMKTLNR